MTMRVAVGAAMAAAIMLTGCSTAPPPAEKTEPAATPPVILQFYASPGTIAKGDHSLLCYGVEGAAAVRLEPAIEEITPSRARCIEVTPAVTTTYTLFAKNAAGAEVSKRLELVIDPKMKSTKTARVAGGGELISFFTLAGPKKVAKGTAVTLCYGVKGASAVSLLPAEQALVPSDRLCFQVKPQVTTSYTLTATSAAGGKDSETVRIEVE